MVRQKKDDAARKSRAEGLREAIDKALGRDRQAPPEDEAAQTLRDFVHRRMRDLDADE